MQLSRRQKQKGIVWLVGGALMSAFFALLIVSGQLQGLHLSLSNYMYWTDDEASDKIILVAVDNKTLADRGLSELGTLQLAKADYARVIENLNERGAGTIGLDIVLSEQSAVSDVEDLADTLARYANVVIAALPKTEQSDALYPLDALRDNARIGSVLFVPDRDNILRRQGKTFDDPYAKKAFAIELVNTYLGIESEENYWIDGGYVVNESAMRIYGKRVEPITIPSDENRQFMLNFFGPPNSFTKMSFADILDGNFVDTEGDPVDVKDKIILIGEVGTALHDEQFVPNSFGTPMPGVEIHANGVQTILEQQFLENQSIIALLAVTIFLILVALALFLVLSIPLSFALLILGLLIYMATGWALFEYGLIINTVFTPFALVLCFILAYVYRYFTEAKFLKESQSAFSQYVSPHVVQEILENPEQLKLGGQKKELSIFFSDIAGFTSISEKLDAEELVEQLNEYLDKMSKVVLEHDGTIDKFIGDAVMAFWNAPADQENHAELACLAALDYQTALTELNKKRASEGKDPFLARIGVNTGEVVVGNMGSTSRFDYTVIGDSVNLAARLEGVNKPYGTLILISESTYEQAKDSIEVREIDLIAVKGKEKGVRVYELVSRKGESTEEQKKLKVVFELGLEAYRKQEWDKAKAQFEQALEIAPDDGPSQLFLERCDELKKEKLPKDWDGVFVLKTK